MRALLTVAMASALAAHAHAQTPFRGTGDFDGDGKPDAVERKVLANGAWQVLVTLGAQPDLALRVVEGDDAGQGSEPVVLVPPGEHDVLFQGTEGPRAFPYDSILLERGLHGRRLVFWHDGMLKTAWLKQPD